MNPNSTDHPPATSGANSVSPHSGGANSVSSHSGGASSVSSPGGPYPYYGNYLTCTVGISLILSILLFFSAGLGHWLTHPERLEITLAILGATLLLALLFGSNLYYFCISGSYLEIRNHIFPWVLKIHHLDEIEGVEFRRGSFNRSDALRVKRKDGPWTGSYHAGSLRRKNWHAFQRALQRRGIPVDNHLRQTNSQPG